LCVQACAGTSVRRCSGRARASHVRPRCRRLHPPPPHPQALETMHIENTGEPEVGEGCRLVPERGLGGLGRLRMAWVCWGRGRSFAQPPATLAPLTSTQHTNSHTTHMHTHTHLHTHIQHTHKPHTYTNTHHTLIHKHKHTQTLSLSLTHHLHPTSPPHPPPQRAGTTPTTCSPRPGGCCSSRWWCS
jgi:hypothetical protein